MEIYSEDNTFHTYEAGGSCSSCSFILPRLVDSAPHYFEKGYVTCEKSGERIDLWQVVSSRAKAGGHGPWTLTSIGAATTSLLLPFESGRYYEINLEEYGVPAGARILWVNFTSQGGENGGVTALAWHANTVYRRIMGTTLRMMTIPIGEGPLPRTGNLSIAVIWVRKEESDGWIYLLSAFEAAADLEYGPALVFAQSAVEISLMPVVASRLRRYAAGDHVKTFMSGSLTFSSALNVVLPNLCGMLGIPLMPDSVRGGLNRLRKRRNQIIHEGTTVANVTSEDAGEGLSAAAFGFEYMRYVGPRLA